MTIEFKILALSAVLALMLPIGQGAAQMQPADASVEVPETMAASPEGRYIYLKTLQHLVDGTSPQFLAALDTLGADALKPPVGDVKSLQELARDMSDPLMLQADPASIIAMSNTLLQLGIGRRDELEAAQRELLAAQPQLADPRIDLGVMDYGLRFRFALSQALYALELKGLPRDQQAAIEAYGARTYGLRDDMEVLEFDIALEGLADDARAAHLRAFAALQRGVMDEMDPYSFEADGKRARSMSDQASRSMAEGMRSMYFQILLLIGIATL